MKNCAVIAGSTIEQTNQSRIVEYISVLGGFRKLENPIFSIELECTSCSLKEHFTPFVDPSKGIERVWICANGDCVTNKQINNPKATTIPVKSQRSILWHKFCEINGIGDVNHDIKFENVKQSEGKISYMLKFASSPRGIILMQGEPGTGKTFAAMAICELFTRKNTSAIFSTQKQMSNNWIETFKIERFSNYIERVSNTCLLVIDDFGTSEMPPGFMSFFMELINTRMQWNDRGTIITTNLDSKKFALFCGEALSDRIQTGQQFEFKGSSRRKKIIL